MTNNYNRKFETPYCRVEIFSSKREVFTFYDANDELWYMHYVIDGHRGPQASCTARTKREIIAATQPTIQSNCTGLGNSRPDSQLPRKTWTKNAMLLAMNEAETIEAMIQTGAILRLADMAINPC